MAMVLRAVSMSFVAAFLFVAGPGIARADDAETARVVNAMFEVGWDAKFSARQAADEKYEQLKQLAPGDRRVANAYGIVLVKQGRYPDAAKIYEGLLKADEKEVRLWVTKIRLSMITKNYMQALVEMENLSALFPPPADEPGDDAFLDHARFLGRMFGFLEGPAATSVSEPLRERYQRKIVDAIGNPRQAVFEQSRKAVLEVFTDLSDAKQETEDKARDEAEAELKKRQQELEEQLTRIDERQKDLLPMRDKLGSEAKAELEGIAKEDRPLIAQLARVDAQASVVRRELALIVADIDQLRERARREKDPAVRDSLLRQADRLSILARRYDTDLAVLERQAAVIQAQRAEIQVRYARTEAQYAAQIARIDAELAELEKQQKRNAADQKRAERIADRPTTAGRGLSVQKSAFTTYDEFPLEAERLRILETFR